MKIIYIKIMILLTLILHLLSCSIQNNKTLRNAKLIHHKPVSEIYVRNLESKLEWVSNTNISDKKYVLSEIKHRIKTINDISKSTDTSRYEKGIINILNRIDTSEGLKRIVILSECSSGEVFSCSDYVFTETKDGCICYSIGSSSGNVQLNGVCDLTLLNTFINYFKERNPIPEEYLLEEFNADNSFDIYEIRNDKIYANKYFTTQEYTELLHNLRNQWNE